jgi:hypothetical protein
MNTKRFKNLKRILPIFLILTSLTNIVRSQKIYAGPIKTILCLDQAKTLKMDKDEKNLILFCCFYLEAYPNFNVRETDSITVILNQSTAATVLNREINKIDHYLAIPFKTECPESIQLNKKICTLVTIMCKYVMDKGDFDKNESTLTLPGNAGESLSLKESESYQDIKWAFADLKEGIDLMKLVFLLEIQCHFEKMTYKEFLALETPAYGILTGSANSEVLYKDEKRNVKGIIGATKVPTEKTEILVFFETESNERPNFKR